MSVSDDKARLRQHYRQLRTENLSTATYENLLDIPEITNAKIIASYISYGKEPSTLIINKSLISLGKKIILPRVTGEELQWRFWEGSDSELEINNGISEPTGPLVTNLGLIDCIVVPALAVDIRGVRLGKGGGFYDRTLVHFSGFSVALIYSNELSSKPLPLEDFDIKVQAALTPEKLSRFNLSL
jgi:5-formyltetrahydrofolate cyclo-ligase